MNTRNAIIAMLLCCCIQANAQNEAKRSTVTAQDDTYLPVEPYAEPRVSVHDAGGLPTVPEILNAAPMANDSLHLPPLDIYGRTMLYPYPYGLAGIYGWDLHPGLNVNLGLSVFATFGKHSSGSGFGQNVAAMYAVPLTPKLSLAVGGYFNSISWSGNPYRNAGLNAVIGYRFDEHWEACIFGQKSLTNNRMPLPLYDMSDIGDRIGASVRYNINPTMSIEVSVSAERDNRPKPIIRNDFVKP